MKLGRKLLLLAILAPGIASSAAMAQQACGGPAPGVDCTNPSQFCEMPIGKCCCEVVGRCVTFPASCPPVTDPVCGCDGETYANRCEAQAVGVSTYHLGPCGPEVTGVQFTGPHEMVWDDMSGALAYNVYIDRGSSSTGIPGFHGQCALSPAHSPLAALVEDPPSDVVYKYEVTVRHQQGEGPLGKPSPGFARRTAVACICTLTPEPGFCTAICPRWTYDYIDARCEPFTWTCCGGNANNFETEEICAATCPVTP